MIKVLGLLKRRSDMTTEAFRTYYETHHRVIGEKYLQGYAVKYQRRYLEALDDKALEHDVLLEVWYPDAATHQAASKHLSQPTIAAEIAADEERLFDRPSNRFFTVTEVESSL